MVVIQVYVAPLRTFVSRRHLAFAGIMTRLLTMVIIVKAQPDMSAALRAMTILEDIRNIVAIQLKMCQDVWHRLVSATCLQPILDNPEGGAVLVIVLTTRLVELVTVTAFFTLTHKWASGPHNSCEGRQSGGTKPFEHRTRLIFPLRKGWGQFTRDQMGYLC